MKYILIFLLITYLNYSKQNNENLLFENVSYIYASNDENNFSKIIMIYNNSYEEYSNELILEKKYNLSLSVGKDTKTCKLETNERIIINKTHYEIINSDNTSVCNYYCLNDSKNKTILSCSKNEFMTVGSNASNNFFFLFYSKEINKTNVSVDKGLNVLKECISGANDKLLLPKMFNRSK